MLIAEDRRIAAQERREPLKFILAPYTEANYSLHVYGQDYTDKGMDNFFQVNPTPEAFLAKCMTSEEAMKKLIIPELEDFLNQREMWKFPPQAIELIDSLLSDIKSGRYVP